ncbi:MAG: GNAT family N-acetyltransferase [Promethearchaeota archaeon]
MVKIDNLVYRNYQPGDERDLADVFNRAFQTNGAGNVRTTSWQAWRYPGRPGFDPRHVNVCEDPATGRVVGQVASEVKTVLIRGKPVPMGAINDVSVDPKYARRGIARRLLDMANDFFRERGVKFSSLDADPNGHARARLYVPDGYRDFVKVRGLVQFPSLGQFLLRDNPLFLAASPVIAVAKYLKRLARRVQDRGHRGDYPVEVRDTSTSKRGGRDFWRAWREVGARYYEWFEPVDLEYWKWQRERVPAHDFRPTHVIVRDGAGGIVAGASLTIQTIYSFRYHFRLRTGIVKDFFVDSRLMPSEPDVVDALTSEFLANLVKGAARRRCSLLIYSCPANDPFALRAFRRVGYIPVPAGVFMVKEHGDEVLEPPERPLFIATNETCGFP